MPTAAELHALAALEASRQTALCRLLEHSMGHWCDDYLRQLATNAVRVRALSEIATIQAELLKHREPSAKAQPATKTLPKTKQNAAKPVMDEERLANWWKSRSDYKSGTLWKKGL